MRPAVARLQGGRNWRGAAGALPGGFSRVHRLSAHGAAYSFFVRLAKIVLPGLALILMGVVIARMQHDPLQDQLTQLAPDEKTVPGQSELTGARYEGVDDKGRPFVLTADKALRVMPPAGTPSAQLIDDRGEAVDLVNPRAEMTSDKSGLALEAETGRFVQDAQKLKLTGGVTLSDRDGNALHLREVDVDLHGRALQSSGPVEGRGPAGNINAEGLKLEDGGDKVIFTGRTTLTLPVKKDGAGVPAAMPEGSAP